MDLGNKEQVGTATRSNSYIAHYSNVGGAGCINVKTGKETWSEIPLTGVTMRVYSIINGTNFKFTPTQQQASDKPVTQNAVCGQMYDLAGKPIMGDDAGILLMLSLSVSQDLFIPLRVADKNLGYYPEKIYKKLSEERTLEIKNRWNLVFDKLTQMEGIVEYALDVGPPLVDFTLGSRMITKVRPIYPLYFTPLIGSLPVNQEVVKTSDNFIKLFESCDTKINMIAKFY
jgi:hypothetical protein